MLLSLNSRKGPIKCLRTRDGSLQTYSKSQTRSINHV